ncbi:MAG: carboxypeptidase-like regulatory domain-containing protein [Bacteroides sp.]|nr:carboxypeptidase-like regulatory domain-containing protein [Bacteroides sp.]MCM1380225.1 carboxypeptidase-like regulatory domain-containing protein [Bacteroides sp.]MCM1446533.1 carboxypeptidase-like regulatory domain-containing protein [Prevotella sp.]
MRFKLLLLMVLACVLPSLAQNASVSGTLVDEYTGAPLSGATVMLREQGLRAVTGPSGQFTISKAKPGKDFLLAMAFGYNDSETPITLEDGKNVDLGFVKLVNADNLSDFYSEQQDMLFDEQALNDEESTAQTINALTGASDNIYYNASNYNFSNMYFRFRGYDSQYQTTYINGINMNDPIRGRFNYSSLGGMTSRAFRNRTTTIGLGASDYGFGNVGGSSNISTITSEYATGFNGSVAYTNANYMLRAMATYATGINSHGWGVTVSAIGRYANEGVIEGTFYNSAGLFVSAEKVFNENHSLTLTAYGAPTQRATSSATYQEVYDLADNNLYNPNWGYWEDGKKRSARVVESFDPTVMLNWVYDNKKGTKVNTGAMFRSVYYSSSALNWFNTSDPRPDYYRNLPSNFYNDLGQPTEQSEYVAELWRTDESVRQINWDRIVHANQLNNIANRSLPYDWQYGASYILENRVSHSLQGEIAANVNHRINSFMTLQGGAHAGYTAANYYKQIRDLLGGDFWIDVDPFSNRDMTIVPDNMQNDLDNPNRRVTKGDKFGYNYTLHAVKAGAWVQNQINLPQWDINYALNVGYTQFYRHGHMRNGRAPENSLGKGKTHDFTEAAGKVGATWKIDGRNYLMAHAEFGSHAPLIENVYISPRIKDDIISDPQCERILAADLTYGWNYRKFRGAVTVFATEFYGATERTSFFDDNQSAFTNYVLNDVRRENIGIEVGLAYKIIPSLTATFAGTVASYRYKNNPMGTRSYENGLVEDKTQRVYLKNYRVGGTPQQAYSIGLDWAAPKQWFLGITANWMRDSWVKLAPVYHEELPGLSTSFPTYDAALAEQREISRQQKMNNAFALNFSIGKLIYINRKVSLNINLNVDNITNNKNIMQNAWQQGRIDTSDWNLNKYPNKYQYAQGTKVFLNVGVRF